MFGLDFIMCLFVGFPMEGVGTQGAASVFHTPRSLPTQSRNRTVGIKNYFLLCDMLLLLCVAHFADVVAVTATKTWKHFSRKKISQQPNSCPKNNQLALWAVLNSTLIPVTPPPSPPTSPWRCSTTKNTTVEPCTSGCTWERKMAFENRCPEELCFRHVMTHIIVSNLSKTSRLPLSY